MWAEGRRLSGRPRRTVPHGERCAVSSQRCRRLPFLVPQADPSAGRSRALGLSPLGVRIFSENGSACGQPARGSRPCPDVRATPTGGGETQGFPQIPHQRRWSPCGPGWTPGRELSRGKVAARTELSAREHEHPGSVGRAARARGTSRPPGAGCVAVGVVVRAAGCGAHQPAHGRAVPGGRHRACRGRCGAVVAGHPEGDPSSRLYGDTAGVRIRRTARGLELLAA